MKIKSLFSWEIPENIYDRGLVHCSRKFGGCGQWHEFTINEAEPHLIELEWEERECDKFEYWLAEEVSQEWAEEISQQWLKIIDKQVTKRNKEQVSIKDTQWEKEFGAVRPVGFYKRRQEFFVCGNCSVELKGSLRHGVVKNRNNPCFWGLTNEPARVLCQQCLIARKEQMPSLRRMKFNQYVKLGMFK